MTFEEDLTKRRIDVAAFAAGDPEKFAAWKMLYQEVHPNSFYTSVKMVINDVRRRFWLQEVPKSAAAPASAVAKPVIKRAGTVPSTASAIPDEPSPSVDRTPEPASAPAPAPKGRAVIRRPVSNAPAAPVENARPPEENTASSASESAIEAPKPGRARPVFRKPAGEAAAEIPAEPESKPAETAETSKQDVEAPKPARPRPVFRKPAPPAESTSAATAPESTLPVGSTDLPEHTNPNPAEAPKPPRPRPVFKKPAAVVPEVPQESSTTGQKPEPTPEPELPAPKAEVPKFPRPRPVIKRLADQVEPTIPEPTKESNAIESNEEQILVKPEVSAPEPADTSLNENLQNTQNPDLPNEVPAPKPPRPRPIFKRPGKSESPEGLAGTGPDNT